jgi:hypothetical protein
VCMPLQSFSTAALPDQTNRVTSMSLLQHESSNPTAWFDVPQIFLFPGLRHTNTASTAHCSSVTTSIQTVAPDQQ